MSNIYIDGDGTSSEPFRPGKRTREIVKVLIGNPRAAATEIHKALVALGIKDPYGFKRGMLAERGLKKALRFRVSLTGDSSDGASTCLLRVTLGGKEKWDSLKEVAAWLSSTRGVVEWDEVTGDFADFLVRVADTSSGDLTTQISKELSKLPSVLTVSTIHLRKSGIVDAFDPEQFLKFREE